MFNPHNSRAKNITRENWCQNSKLGVAQKDHRNSNSRKSRFCFEYAKREFSRDVSTGKSSRKIEQRVISVNFIAKWSGQKLRAEHVDGCKRSRNRSRYLYDRPRVCQHRETFVVLHPPSTPFSFY